MAAQLGLFSVSHQLQNLVESQQQHYLQPPPPPSAGATTGYWMRNTKNAAAAAEEEDSWEIRAFAEDTGNNATWPPRSYTCTFCRREFRSAQALGGHMNVHRRDRARLHHAPQRPSVVPPHFPSPAAAALFPPQEIVANASLCLLYSLPNPNAAAVKPCNVNSSPTLLNSSPTLLSISPFATTHNLPSLNFPATTQFITASSLKVPAESSQTASNNNNNYRNGTRKREADIEEQLELDLELRLGRGSSSSSSSSPPP